MSETPYEPSAEQIAKLAAFMAEFDTGMRVFVVGSEDESERIAAEQKAQGWHCGGISSAGLPPGQWRLTFLPDSAFADSQEPASGDDEPARIVAGPPVSRQPQRDVRDLVADIDKIAEVPYEHDHPTILPEGLRIIRETVSTCAPETGGTFRGVDILVEDFSGEHPRRLQTRGRVFEDNLYIARLVALDKAIEWHTQLLEMRRA